MFIFKSKVVWGIFIRLDVAIMEVHLTVPCEFPSIIKQNVCEKPSVLTHFNRNHWHNAVIARQSRELRACTPSLWYG
jgi:hypothetical protein